MEEGQRLILFLLDLSPGLYFLRYFSKFFLTGCAAYVI
jgi:hypothetical protein